MKFNKYLPIEIQEMLENQYKEYIKVTPMTKKEQRAVREWVKDGHSVYENPNDAWEDGQVPVDFLTIYRDEEYIRQCTKGMNAEAARKFALEYYGWSDEVEELPFLINYKPHGAIRMDNRKYGKWIAEIYGKVLDVYKLLKKNLSAKSGI